MAQNIQNKIVIAINTGISDETFRESLLLLSNTVPIYTLHMDIPKNLECNWLQEAGKAKYEEYHIPIVLFTNNSNCFSNFTKTSLIAILYLNNTMMINENNKIIQNVINDLEHFHFLNSSSPSIISFLSGNKTKQIIWIFLIISVIIIWSLILFLWKYRSYGSFFSKRIKIQTLSPDNNEDTEVEGTEELGYENTPSSNNIRNNDEEVYSERDHRYTSKSIFLSNASSDMVISSRKDQTNQKYLNNFKNEPVNSLEFANYLNKFSKIITNYYENSISYYVTPDSHPGSIFKNISKTPPQNPESFEDICSDFESIILNGLTHWQHPRFYAYFPAGRNYACMIADLAISSLGVVGFSWDSCPVLTEMESAMVNWVGRAIGLPEKFLFQENIANSVGGGCMMDSASDAIHNVLIASRNKKIKEILKTNEIYEDYMNQKDYLEKKHDICKKCVVYTSIEAHSSIEKGCKLAMINCTKILTKRENDYGMRGSEIEKEIIKDIENGFIPMHIHVTIGTTSTAASDHLESIWPIAQNKGIENVTSINVNTHKFLQHSVGCSILWIENQKVFKDAFQINPIYLKPTHNNSNDFRDWGISLSKRFICLKSWFVFRLYGIEGLQNYIERLINCAKYFESLISTHPNCRLFGKRKHALFCFQYVEPNMREDEISRATRDFCTFLNKSRLLLFTLTQVENYSLIRVSINYAKVDINIINDSWICFQDLLSTFWRKRQNSKLIEQSEYCE